MARHPGHVKPFTYGSVCSGIEAATVAWEPLGWHPAFFAEIDRFPSAVLKHHYPDIPNAGDFTAIQDGNYATIDLLVGGTPCQDFSVAGLRAGMAGERGNLTLEFLRLAQRLRPRWLVWENVPGVYSSTSHVVTDHGELREGSGDEGERRYLQDCEAVESHAFACFLAGLQELGYGFAYRTLDAQHFGIPQRRRRVFVVGYLGDWRRAAAVLFERHSLSGHPPPRREARQVAPTIPARRLGGGGLGTDFDCDGGLVASTGRGGTDQARTQAAGEGRARNQTHSQVAIASTGDIAAYGGNNCSGPIDVATAVNACASASGRMDFESETFIVAADRVVSTLDSSYARLQGCSGQDANHGHSHLISVAAHTTPSEGCLTPDAPQRVRIYGVDGVAPTLQSEEGRGHGVPTIALEARAEVQAVAFRTNAAGQVDCQGDKAAAVTTMTDPCAQFIAFSCKDHGADAGETSPTLRAMAHSGSHANAGGQVAVAFKASHYTRGKDGAPSQIHPPLSADADKGDQDPLILAPLAFRASGQDGFTPAGISPPIAASDGGGSGVPTVAIQNALRGKSQNGLGISDDDTMYTLDQASQHAVAFESRFARNGRGAPSDIVPPLKAQSGQTDKGDAAPLVATTMAVRRLTPRECERLQGFPDDYTKIGDKTADGPRYKALGNSMAVPCMYWIGERIQMVEDLIPPA